MKKVIAGMDLHSNNVVIDVMDLDGQRLASRKLPCELKEVVRFLAPFRKRLEQVAVESTYNWYWLVDGLQALKYPVVLANPAGMEQYSGIKHADDTNQRCIFCGGVAAAQDSAHRPHLRCGVATGARPVAPTADVSPSAHGADAQF
jgi:hypothetical protein